jgi:hypothetical protein
MGEDLSLPDRQACEPRCSGRRVRTEASRALAGRATRPDDLARSIRLPSDQRRVSEARSRFASQLARAGAAPPPVTPRIRTSEIGRLSERATAGLALCFRHAGRQTVALTQLRERGPTRRLRPAFGGRRFATSFADRHYEDEEPSPLNSVRTDIAGSKRTGAVALSSGRPVVGGASKCGPDPNCETAPDRRRWRPGELPANRPPQSCEGTRLP